MQKKRGIKIAAAIILGLLLVFVVCGLINPLAVERITIESEKIDIPVRIALISDLHSCYYGEGQKDLIEALNEQEPDLVCLVGDIFDDVLPDDNSVEFLTEISRLYTCYYVTGNHEYRGEKAVFHIRMNLLEELGIKRLSCENKEIEVNGQKINICGMDDPDSCQMNSGFVFLDSLDELQRSIPNDYFTLLLSHRPEYMQIYADHGFDLVLCGHAHGGQWRIPLLLKNGLFAPHQGFFPEYTSGEYTMSETTEVVSRGLGKESIHIPRFYNRPEIVIIDLQKIQQKQKPLPLR